MTEYDFAISFCLNYLFSMTSKVLLAKEEPEEKSYDCEASIFRTVIIFGLSASETFVFFYNYTDAKGDLSNDTHHQGNALCMWTSCSLPLNMSLSMKNRPA